MIEIGLAVAACILMSKIADAEGRSTLVWGTLTLLLCVGSLAIPLPFLRILLAGVVAFIALMVAKARAGR
jgi:succinate-acetate transporter protein